MDRIASIDARAVSVPLQHPIRTANGVIDATPLVLVDLVTANGIHGRSYVFAYTPLVLAATRSLVLELGHRLQNAELAPLAIDHAMSAELRLLGRSGLAAMAAAGIDMAVWDAFAIGLGMPLAQVLGASPGASIQAYDSHSKDGLALGVQRARQAMDNGYRAIKTKLGYATLEEDIRIVRALREALDPGAQLFVDYNQSLSVDEAIRRIRALELEGVGWVEEPTLQEDYAGHARIREKVQLPIQFGENWTGVHEMAKSLAAGASDLIMVDPMNIGGVSSWLRAAALAQVHGLRMSSHLFPEISVHLLAATPTAHWLEFMDIAGPILATRPEIDRGNALIPGRPGVGMSWDEAAVAQYLCR